MHSRDDFVGAAHPVQRGVAENRVEFAVEGERVAVHHVRVEAEGARAANLRLARIDADHFATHRNQLGG